jgi:hypothetical protein
VADHAEAGSLVAERLLSDWDRTLGSFLLVEPVEPGVPAGVRPAADYPAVAAAGSATVVGRASRSGSVQDQAAPWNLPTAP